MSGALPHWKIVTNDRVGRTTDEGAASSRASAGPLLSTSSSASARTTCRMSPAFGADVARVLELVGPTAA